jgi:hypothetical protein
MKPHLFLPLAIVLLLWVVSRKAWSILAGLLLALLASYALTLAFDPHIGTEFVQMMHGAALGNRYTPTLSLLFRISVYPHTAWLEFLPQTIACFWAIWYFLTRSKRWQWMREGSLLLLISILCTPYAWVTDESVLLPAVIFGLYRALQSRRSLLPLILFAAFPLIELYANVPITSRWYTWTAPAWLAWYLYATAGKTPPASEDSIEECL